MKALFLNCTLKKSPEESNTEALIDKAIALFDRKKVDTEVVRIVDHNIPVGITDKVDDKDEWPIILKKIIACDILVIASPIWMGVRASTTQLIMERLDGSVAGGNNPNGQFILYNKVAGVLVTGNEDGAHSVCETTLYNLTHFGATIPPNVDSYWVGEAGPGKSYIKAGGDKHLFTNRTLRYMVENLTHMAEVLKENPFPIDIKKVDKEAKKESRESD